MSKRFDWDEVNRLNKAAHNNHTANDVDRGWRQRIKAQQDKDKLTRLEDSKEQLRYEREQEAHRRKYWHMVQRIRRERQNQGR